MLLFLFVIAAFVLFVTFTRRPQQRWHRIVELVCVMMLIAVSVAWSLDYMLSS